MERTGLLLNKSKFHLQNAYNAMNKTYPLVRENKIMIIAVNNLFMAFNSCVLAVIEHATSDDKVAKIPDNFESRLKYLKILHKKNIRLSNFDKSSFDLGLILKEYVLAHRNSSIEFSRSNNYIICDGSFNYKILSIKILKEHYIKTKLFIDEAIRFTHIK